MLHNPQHHRRTMAFNCLSSDWIPGNLKMISTVNEKTITENLSRDSIWNRFIEGKRSR
jgi:hypothetical protein